MEKSLELFARQGFEATTVQQITEYCGISKGAFYLSFKSKDELILALIDHFMHEILADIDCVVKNTNRDQLLFEFYYTIFHSFQKNSDFTKILIKEQAQSFNEEFIFKMGYYDKLMESHILLMIERLYGEGVKSIQYDLIFCIKGFMNVYSQLFIFYNVPIDLDLLCRSLVEKTDLLARHTSIPFISKELILLSEHPMKKEITKEQILEIIEQKIEELEDSIEKESLILLKQHLIEQNLSRAIVKGLLENIRYHPQCKWIAYLLRNYF